MIQEVERENCVTYVQVSKGEYSHLIAVNARMEVLKDYMKSAEYPDSNTIKTILGIEKGEN